MDKKYESIFIMKNIENMDKIKETIEQIKNMVISEGGNICYEDELGVKTLAYEIKGNKKGYYYLINFTISDSKKDIEGKIATKIHTLEEVIKHITVKMEDD